jgi:hypothetical protein
VLPLLWFGMIVRILIMYLRSAFCVLKFYKYTII